MEKSLVSLPAALYVVSTPIGNSRDITLRALDVLAAADVLAAEDTRMARRLLELYGLSPGQRPLIAYHDHNGKAQRPRLLAALEAGRSVAYVSDAGTPMVADPGYVLCREAIEAGHQVVAVPGASAMLAGLTVSGLPTDRFLFGGFAPTKPAARRRFFGDFESVQATLVFYESPRRLRAALEDMIAVWGPRRRAALCRELTKKFETGLRAALEDMIAVWGPRRRAALCRELTKKFEEVRRGSLAELLEGLDDMTLKGELVICVERAAATPPEAEDVEAALRRAMLSESLKDAAASVAKATGLPRRQVYQIALGLDAGGDSD